MEETNKIEDIKDASVRRFFKREMSKLHKQLVNKMPIDLLSVGPSHLPGFDADGNSYFVRDQSGFEPWLLFHSKTITSKDPLFIKLAYLVFEEDSWDSQVLELLSEDLLKYPSGAMDETEMQRAMVKGDVRHQQRIMHRFNLPSLRADTITELFQKYHTLTVWVLYIWGGEEEMKAKLVRFFAETVNMLWLESRRFVPGRSLASEREEFDLAYEQRLFQAGADAWEEQPQPFLFGTLIGQLRDVITSAGTTLRKCRNCDRFFVYGGRGQQFCSPQCQNAFGMRKARSKRAEKV